MALNLVPLLLVVGPSILNPIVRRFAYAALALSMLLGTGCELLETAPASTEPVAAEPVQTLELPEPARQDTRSPAIAQLLSQADELLREQEYSRASAVLERALRIAPEQAHALFALAQVRYYQQQYHQSRLLLQRARLVSSQDATLRKAIEGFSQRLDAVEL